MPVSCSRRTWPPGGGAHVTLLLSHMPFNTVEQAIADIAAGKLVIVADDEDRENEGDLICAAQLITPESVNFMIKRAGGLICIALTGERVDQLGLLPMAETNLD